MLTSVLNHHHPATPPPYPQIVVYHSSKPSEFCCIPKCLYFILNLEWWWFWFEGFFPQNFLGFNLPSKVSVIFWNLLQWWEDWNWPLSISVTYVIWFCLFPIHDAPITLDFMKFCYELSETKVNLSYEFMNFSLFQGFTEKPVILCIPSPLITSNIKRE